MGGDANDRPASDLVLLGGGGHAKVVYDAALRAGWRVRGFLDDSAEAPLASIGARRLGPIRSFSEHQDCVMLVAIGANARRVELSDEMARSGIDFATVIHPAAVVSESAQVGVGVFVGAGVVISPDARIDRAVIVNTGAVVEHDVVVEAGAHLAPNSTVAGEARIGAEALIGAAAVVIPGRRVGARAVVGAGAVVVHDIEPGETVAGAPARPLR
ncbi:MAG: NeuD/PglB/VioB family sugar acetyltransferase [Phycisphaerales bacterium]